MSMDTIEPNVSGAPLAVERHEGILRVRMNVHEYKNAL